MAGSVCVTVRAPSSTANLGAGFDVLAVAHTLYEDQVVACASRGSGGVYVEAVEGPYAGESGGGLTAVRAVEALLRGLEAGGVVVRLRIVKGVPVGRGFGSSGASAAAAVYAAYRALRGLLGDTMPRLGKSELVVFAGEGEAAAAGEPHYDNVAASLLGGVVVVARSSKGGVRVYSFRPGAPFNLAFAVAEGGGGGGKTRRMRSLLPCSLELGEAVGYAGRAAMLAAALARGDLELVGELMMSDELFEARRAGLLPCYREVVRAALSEGAYGVSLSGAGPSMAALAPPSLEKATRIARAMAKAYRAGGCGGASPAIARVDTDGARVVWEETR